MTITISTQTLISRIFFDRMTIQGPTAHIAWELSNCIEYRPSPATVVPGSMIAALRRDKADAVRAAVDN